jgi:hypothetical protein
MSRKRKTSTQPIGMKLLQATFVVNNKQKMSHTRAVDKIVDEAHQSQVKHFNSLSRKLSKE